MKNNKIKIAGLTGIVISLSMVCLSFIYIQKTSVARDAHNEELYNYNTNNQYVTQTMVGRLSKEIGTMSAVGFGYSIILSVIGLSKFKRMIFLFPGVVCCTGMLVWTYVLINNPMAITFDEVGPVWIVMAVMQCIVSIHLIKAANGYQTRVISTTSLYHEGQLR